MIVDSSALVAIVRDEPDADRYIAALAEAGRAAMSAASWVESTVVVDSARDPVASRRFDELVHVAGVAIVAVDAEQAYRRSSGVPRLWAW